MKTFGSYTEIALGQKLLGVLKKAKFPEEEKPRLASMARDIEFLYSVWRVLGEGLGMSIGDFVTKSLYLKAKGRIDF